MIHSDDISVFISEHRYNWEGSLRKQITDIYTFSNGRRHLGLGHAKCKCKKLKEALAHLLSSNILWWFICIDVSVLHRSTPNFEWSWFSHDQKKPIRNLYHAALVMLSVLARTYITFRCEKCARCCAVYNKMKLRLSVWYRCLGEECRNEHPEMLSYHMDQFGNGC
jgi:hypothetical protein